MSGHAVASIGWTLVHFLWQGALVGLATALLLRILRGAAPERRYLVACAGLLACLLWPAAELAARLAGGGAAPAPGFLPPHPERVPDGSAALAALLATHLPQLVAAWAAGALALALRLAAGIAWVHRCAALPRPGGDWERRAGALARAMGIRRTVRLRAVEGLDGPVTAGWLRPLVLLPASLLSGMPPEMLHALLAHELAHVRRWDYPVNLAQNLIETVLFYHPAVWWISRQVRAERELVADAIAARALDGPRVLAEALAALEAHRSRCGVPGRAVVAANGGALLARIRALLQPPPRRSGRGAGMATACAACVALLALAGASAAGIRAGDPDVPAVLDIASCAKPEYPAVSLAAEHTGTVTLVFQVGGGGEVLGGTVRRSSGHESLDKAALDALVRCRFTPALSRGKPVPSMQAVQYVWTLQ